MQTTRSLGLLALTGGALALCWGAVAPAQPAVRAERPPAASGQDENAERDVAAERIRARLMRLRGRIDESIAALDAGAPAREVFRSMRDDMASALDRPAGPMPDREPPPMDEPLAEGEAARLLEEHLPTLHARLTSPDAALPGLREHAAERIARRVRLVLDETEHDPELRALKLDELRTGADVFEAARRYREAAREGDGARQSARDALETALRAQIDARHAVARAELERLEQRVERMQRDVARQSDRRDEEVARMLERMVTAPERRGADRRERP